MKAQDTAELFFTDVKVPKENLLGDPSKAMGYLMQGLAEERLIGAVGYLAMAHKAMDITVEFAKQRRLFGKALCEFQNTQFKLAELQAELDIQQVYIDQAVAAFNEDAFTAVDAAKAKLATRELLCRVVDECLQQHGGAGYMNEYPIARLYADAGVTRIYAGSSEVMKLIISRDMFQGDAIPFNEKNL